jgi:hypothetical protein
MADGQLTYAVRPAVVALFALGAVAALAAVAAIPDRPGRFLFAVAAAGFAAEAVRSALLRPTLTADAGGIDVASGLGRATYPWSAVAAVDALRPPTGGGRLRRRADALEIDLGDRLVLVPAYRLGRAAAAVAGELDSLRRGASGDRESR